MLRKTALIALILGLARVASGNTYTVTNTNDAGVGSLRQAIMDASAHPGDDSIAFAIPGSGVHTIALASDQFDASNGRTTIDGYTQAGSSPNTNPPDQGSNAVLRIEINGQNHRCFSTNSAALEIRGLAINGCSPAIAIFGGSGHVIAGNFLGTDPTGVTALPNSVGVAASSVTSLVVGGTLPADRNVIVGSTAAAAVTGSFSIQGNLIGLNAAGTETFPGTTGIQINGGSGIIGGTSAGARNVIAGFRLGSNSLAVNIGGFGPVTVQGNFVGTDVTGTRVIRNRGGIRCFTNCTIGGGAPGAGNVIAGSDYAFSGKASVVQGNFIGTDTTGTLDMGNRTALILGDDCTVGGIGPGEGNVIAFNGVNSFTTAIQVGGIQTRIRGNRIYRNASRGIDLGPSDDNPHANDPGDADTGPNNLQNYPIIASVDYGASTTVHAFLDSAPSTIFDVDFFANPACDARPAQGPQGELYVGTTQTTTDGSGHAAIDFVPPAPLQAGQPVTAIATDPDGNSSEFSQSLILSSNVPAGPSGGFPGYELTGQLFESGAAVKVGGVPLAGVVVDDPSHLSATMRPRPPGSVNDVVVINPSGLTGTWTNGYIANFLDANGLGLFDADIVRLVRNEITAGVGGGNYGTNENIKRQSMAVFVLKAKHGVCYTPPPCTGVFSDVPCPSPFAPWIEAMSAEGITGGCGAGLFCPLNPVRRDQMAVFLLKAEHGGDFAPPPCVGKFLDVPCPGQFADWIEQLATESITGGCGGLNFCPSTNNTRGQMATFLVRTFKLP